VIGEGYLLSGRYRLLALVGEGGMAFVYKAHDEELDRTVAIKILRPEYSTGDVYRREARLSAKLPHPNVVTVYDVGREEDIEYIVMEYVPGHSLKELIRIEAPFRVSRAVTIIGQICKAVSYAHQQGIVHCDLKPQNVLVLPNGVAKVTDFGIARACTPGTSQPSNHLGTPHYASPELFAGEPLTPASDVYAIGVMLYEMLAGRPPFDGPSAAAVARQHLGSPPPPIHDYNPRVPHCLQQILDRALAKDPSDRYRTASQIDRLLTSCRQRSAAITQPIAPVVATGDKAQSHAEAESVPASESAVSAPPRHFSIDWVMLLLAGFAFLSVMGLLPLWGTVITRAIGSPPLVPTATLPVNPSHTPTATVPLIVVPSPTPTAEVLVRVPLLIGVELDAARQLADEHGLTLLVTGQEHDPEVPAKHILQQHPDPDQQVPRGDTVEVMVSLGPQMAVVPELVGFPIAVKELDLSDLGLVTVITETWSTEPIGLVLEQQPPAGTELRLGSSVTVTVSGGPMDQVQANYDNRVLLQSCEFNALQFRPGESAQIIITWHVLSRLSESYTVFIHITDADGRILTQLDRPPLGGSRPTNTWQAGEKFLDPYVIPLPRDAPPGSYWVKIGFYRGTRRLPVVDPGLAEALDDAVFVRQIEIRPG